MRERNRKLLFVLKADSSFCSARSNNVSEQKLISFSNFKYFSFMFLDVKDYFTYYWWINSFNALSQFFLWHGYGAQKSGENVQRVKLFKFITPEQALMNKFKVIERKLLFSTSGLAILTEINDVARVEDFCWLLRHLRLAIFVNTLCSWKKIAKKLLRNERSKFWCLYWII